MLKLNSFWLKDTCLNLKLDSKKSIVLQDIIQFEIFNYVLISKCSTKFSTSWYEWSSIIFIKWPYKYFYFSHKKSQKRVSTVFKKPSESELWWKFLCEYPLRKNSIVCSNPCHFMFAIEVEPAFITRMRHHVDIWGESIFWIGVTSKSGWNLPLLLTFIFSILL